MRKWAISYLSVSEEMSWILEVLKSDRKITLNEGLYGQWNTFRYQINFIKVELAATLLAIELLDSNCGYAQIVISSAMVSKMKRNSYQKIESSILSSLRKLLLDGIASLRLTEKLAYAQIAK